MRNYKKTVLCFLPLVVIVLLAATVLASNPATIRIDNTEAICGTSVDVPIYFDNSEGVGGGVITISYDPTKVTPVGVIKNASLPWTVPKERDSTETYNLDIIANLNHSASTIKLAWVVDPRVGLPASGRLGYVRFQLNRMDGTSLNIVAGSDDDFALFNIEAVKVPSSPVNGGLTGKDLDEVSYGNLKGFGSPDVRDAVMCMRFRAMLIDLGPNQITSGDVDGNSTLNIDDAKLIMEHRAGLISKFPVEE